MCIRDRSEAALQCHGAIGYTVEFDLHFFMKRAWALASRYGCLLYTSDAADDLLCVDLGGRRIIKKKNAVTHIRTAPQPRIRTQYTT